MKRSGIAKRPGIWIALLVVAIGALLPATSEAHRGRHGFHKFFHWWKQPPADPVVDVSFATVDVTGAQLATVVVSSSSLVSKTRTSYDDGTTTAAVAASVLTIDPFTVTDPVSGDTIDVTLDPVTLVQDYFKSGFLGAGTATTSAGGSLTVNVVGRISTDSEDGEYYLRACVGGFSETDNGDGTTTYQFLRLKLNGTVAIPTP